MRLPLLLLLSVAYLACSTVEEGPPKMTVRGKVTAGARQPAPLSNAYVGYIVPSAQKWVQIKFTPGTKLVNMATTDAQGAFTYDIQWEVLADFPDRPVYLAASDAEGSFTLLAEIPRDLIQQGATLELDVNPKTTAAGLWHCPHGVFTTPDYACPKNVTCQYSGGAGCWQDPNASADNAQIVQGIENVIAAQPTTSIPEPAPRDLGTWIRALLDNPDMLAQLNGILQERGRWPVDPAVVERQVRAQSLPIIPKPTLQDLNDGSCGTPGNICGPGTVCVSPRSCIPSALGGTCSCSTNSIEGQCQSGGSTCNAPGGPCGSGSACCQGETCINGKCEAGYGRCPKQ